MKRCPNCGEYAHHPPTGECPTPAPSPAPQPEPRPTPEAPIGCDGPFPETRAEVAEGRRLQNLCARQIKPGSAQQWRLTHDLPSELLVECNFWTDYKAESFAAHFLDTSQQVPRESNICPRCEGTGTHQRLPNSQITKCAICGGSGKICGNCGEPISGDPIDHPAVCAESKDCSDGCPDYRSSDDSCEGNCPTAPSPAPSKAEHGQLTAREFYAEWALKKYPNQPHLAKAGFNQSMDDGEAIEFAEAYAARLRAAVRRETMREVLRKAEHEWATDAKQLAWLRSQAGE